MIHGHHISLPVPLGLSATFNPNLVREGYHNIAEEAVNMVVNNEILKTEKRDKPAREGQNKKLTG